MNRLKLATLLVALTPVGAYADACMDAATSQASMNACAHSAYQAADAQLNEQYNKIRQRLSGEPDARNQLRDAQRAWVAFRDAECAFASSSTQGGTAYQMVHSLCLADLTQERNERFNTFLACEEGDMSCPVPSGD